MRIALASDHAGFSLKTFLTHYLQSAGHEVRDFGAPAGDRFDYPDFAHPAARAIAAGECDRGIFICGSGIGMCMVANRTPGVRAVVMHDAFDAEMSRRHNNANVACFGARAMEETEMLRLIDLFLVTPFEGGRHEERVAKIDKP